MNHFLRRDAPAVDGQPTVSVLDAVDTSSHARFSVRERTYVFRMLNARPEHSAFESATAWCVGQDLDVDSMRQAGKLLCGQHDFTSMRGKDCTASSPVKIVNDVQILPVQASFMEGHAIMPEAQLLLVVVKARSFLHHMVSCFALARMTQG